MVTITDEELLEKARALFKELGGMKSQNARTVRALIERAGIGRQPTKRAGDECDSCHDKTYITLGNGSVICWYCGRTRG